MRALPLSSSQQICCPPNIRISQYVSQQYGPQRVSRFGRVWAKAEEKDEEAPYPSNMISSPSPDIVSGEPKNIADDFFYKSWSFTPEANDTGSMESYFAGDQYLLDSISVSEESLAFAKTIEIAGDGKDVWIFDIDETLLSNLPFNAAHGFRMENIDKASCDEWVESAACPALPASLKLYNELRGLGFSIVLLTGRYEYQRMSTVKNLISAGFYFWEKLILKGPLDEGKPGMTYKSEKRKELEAKGYRIHGNSGDQWSDLLGSSAATRSFKLPNPMYNIP